MADGSEEAQHYANRYKPDYSHHLKRVRNYLARVHYSNASITFDFWPRRCLSLNNVEYWEINNQGELFKSRLYILYQRPACRSPVTLVSESG